MLQLRHSLTQLAQSRFVLGMRESFLAVLPVYLLLQLLGLALFLLHWLQPEAAQLYQPQLQALGQFSRLFWPLAIAASTATHFARAYGIDPLYALLLLLSLGLISLLNTPAGQTEAQLTDWLMLASIAMPLASVLLLRLLIRHLPRFDRSGATRFSPALSRTLVHGLPFVLVLLLLSGPALLLPQALHEPQGRLGEHLPPWLFLLLRQLLSNFLWWMGISGSTVTNWLSHHYFAQQDVLPGVSVETLIFNFMVPGGCGATLALTACLIWYRRQLPERNRHIWRWALPLQIFNVNELLTFGLPVVGNLSLLLPFLLVPMLNSVLVYLVVVEWQWLPVLGSWDVHWMTPFFVSAFFMQSKWLGVLLLQVLVFVLSVLVYRPFVKRWLSEEQLGEASWALAQRMNLGPGLEMFAEARFVKRHEAQHEWSRRAQEALRLLQTGTLCMHYQPKLDLQRGEIVGLEALLRLRLADGSCVEPGRFLPALEQAGFGDMLDLWVVRQVTDDLRRWHAAGFETRVAINLSAATLGEEEAFDEILATMLGFKTLGLEAELLESSLIQQPELVRARLGRLREAGVRVNVDDFGTGYSNLTVFHNAAVDVVKLDRSLLMAAAEPRGAALYREVCAAMQRLGYEVLAEGVETAEEGEFVAACGVALVQGWWISRPLEAAAVPAGVAALAQRFGPQQLSPR
ncbi:EAL domain-containing protein (putative c-di-GMP-specific phosphodiesterase class I)/cellobiose-specific phosphotransferase system component IIC [Paucibacter oligotrophus]|uniref:EAL domain-containing protein (Putative c-di-GMP-specific phosphodiesterase class I)/cellobiose-specific phosphotransferase system component IIC n=1 Tax=Roseateles oligotrophus TaxID=1769250 RepID=A0A840L1A8_9BURK|nr:EAL domain-containing protein [Roseateles oligotrophus]MBB4842234.1 EAL domain-containing protein (putative c-di-GMP-specific phosphodiesterase class I)/cellobiose-specific phosphotransferase system component IIC [Roseateles oligotrophus]